MRKNKFNCSLFAVAALYVIFFVFVPGVPSEGVTSATLPGLTAPQTQVTTPVDIIVPNTNMITKTIMFTPANFTATLSSDKKSVSLSWSSSAGATGYSIERKTGSSGTYAVLAGTAQTTYKDSTVAAGKTYYYRVRAKYIIEGTTSYSGYSTEASVSTPMAAISTGTFLKIPSSTIFKIYPVISGSSESEPGTGTASGVPAAPGNLAAVASGTDITLTWIDNAVNETGFKIEAKSEGGTFTELAVVDTPNIGTITCGGASAGSYYFRIRAYNAQGDSPYSNTAEVNIAETESGTEEEAGETASPGAPEAPSDLEAMVSGSEIILSWTDNAGNETGFKIEAKSEGGDFAEIGIIGPDVETVPCNGVSAGSYSFRIRAYNDAGESAYSNSAEVTVVNPGNQETGAGTGTTPAQQGSKVIVIQIGNPLMAVNGVSQEIDPGRGTAPAIINERTLLPIRAVVEALGGTIDWSAIDQKVTIQDSGTEILLWIGSSDASVNGQQAKIDPANSNVVPLILNERTMLPVRFVSEKLGAGVKWDEPTQSVTITR